jgi:hypothetical protein
VGFVDVAAFGRIIGGFFLLMIGFGVILDTSWDTLGAMLCLAGGGGMLWGAWMRE